MKIVMGGFPKGGTRIVTIHEAVENSISDSISDHAVAIGMLVQLLVDKEVLTLEQISPMLGYRYTVEE